MKNLLRLIGNFCSYHVFMSIMRIKDPEFARRFDRIRALHKADAPAWQRDREINGLDEYMRVKYARPERK